MNANEYEYLNVYSVSIGWNGTCVDENVIFPNQKFLKETLQLNLNPPTKHQTPVSFCFLCSSVLSWTWHLSPAESNICHFRVYEHSLFSSTRVSQRCLLPQSIYDNKLLNSCKGTGCEIQLQNDSVTGSGAQKSQLRSCPYATFIFRLPCPSHITHTHTFMFEHAYTLSLSNLMS